MSYPIVVMERRFKVRLQNMPRDGSPCGNIGWKQEAARRGQGQRGLPGWPKQHTGGAGHLDRHHVGNTR